jgi:hypothetical protein
MNRSRLITLSAIIVLAGVSSLPAVRPAAWVHDQPKDFNEGHLDGTVVTSLGEVTLARQIKTLHPLKDEGKIINALARAGDGKVYAGTGPKGIIYQIDGTKITEFCVLPEGGSVLSLLFTRDGQLLAGTGGGPQAKIYLVDGGGKARVFHEPKGATYIWAMARGVNGEVFAATGNKGQLFKISRDGSKSQVLADLKPKNLLCLAFGADGFLYTGTDEEGLVCRISPTEGKPFVLYDAREPEISAIVFDAQGNLYFSTADAEGARPGRAIADKPGGKPEPAPSRFSLLPRISVSTRRPAGTASQPSTATASAAASQPAGKPAQPKASGADEEVDGMESPTTRQATTPSRIGRPLMGGSAKPGGNAVYRIDTDGFVTEVFREPVMILCMAEVAGTIYAGTGNEGRIYAITPAEDRTTMLAKLETSQVTTLLRMPDNRLVAGTANAPMLVEVADRYAAKGTLISKVLDADQIVSWGEIHWEATVPTGTKLSIATRSGNVEDEDAGTWEAWSPELDATRPQQIYSANARFLQYRVSFETTVPDASPVLRVVEIPRIEQNRAPLITALDVVPAADEAKKPTAPPKVKMAAGMSAFGGGGGDETPVSKYNWVVKWMANDPNGDPLTFEVFYRDLGTTRWIRLAKNVAEPFHIWDTRTVPDGRYEVRVQAKDNKTNPHGTELAAARISDPITVDNTPPNVTIESIEPRGSRSLVVHASFTDALSRIGEASYAVDSNDEWQPLAADDGIFDAPEESVTFTIEDLEPGEHRIALRVCDEQGNMRYVTRLVTVGG